MNCSGCSTLSNLITVPCTNGTVILLCHNCIKRFKIYVKNFIAITNTPEIDLAAFIDEFL